MLFCSSLVSYYIILNQLLNCLGQFLKLGTEQKVFIPSPPGNLENHRFSFVIDRMFIGRAIFLKMFIMVLTCWYSKPNLTVLGLKNREKILSILKEMLWIRKNITNIFLRSRLNERIHTRVGGRAKLSQSSYYWPKPLNF